MLVAVDSVGLIYFILQIIMGVVWLWALVDAAGFSTDEHAAIKSNRRTWVISLAVVGLLGNLLFVGSFFFGFLVGAIYLLWTGRRLRQAHGPRL